MFVLFVFYSFCMFSCFTRLLEERQLLVQRNRVNSSLVGASTHGSRHHPFLPLPLLLLRKQCNKNMCSRVSLAVYANNSVEQKQTRRVSTPPLGALPLSLISGLLCFIILVYCSSRGQRRSTRHLGEVLSFAGRANRRLAVNCR